LTSIAVLALSAGAFAADPAAQREFFADQPRGLGEHYTAWKAIYVGEFLGNVSGGLDQGAIYEGYLKVGFALNLEKLLGWDDTVFYANLLAPHGDSLSAKFVGDLNVVSNIDAYDSLRIFKLFVQRNFGDGRFTIRLGIIAADKDFFVSQGAGLFLNSGFGTFPVIGQNLVAPIYPVSAPGIRLTWSPAQALSFRAALFSGDVGSASSSRHGTRWNFSGKNGAAAFLEGAWTTTLAGDLPGTYKLGAFYDSKSFSDLRGRRSHAGDYGLYVIGDQQLWRVRPLSGDTSTQGLAIFGRIAVAPPDRNLVDLDAEAGVTYTGLLPRRPDDVLSLGVLYSRISPDARVEGGRRFESNHEAVLEISYQAAIHRWLTLQPDFQYIVNPGAVRHTPNAVVAGLRCILSF
ncbi:MAG: carbohydrate porin, partial [Chloroflexota bacterium]|nr:carbohydrate porin [Chloroflexota bacterium]